MALITAAAGTSLQRGITTPLTDSLSPQARRLVLVAGVFAAACFGALVPTLGASTTILYAAGGAALLAAVLSSYAALVLLIVLLLVPMTAVDLLPIHLNSIDAVYAAAIFGVGVRAVVSGKHIELGALGLALVGFLLTGLLALTAGVLSSAQMSSALGHFRGIFGYALIPVLVLQIGGERIGRRQTLLAALCIVGALTAARGVLSWAELNGVAELGSVFRRLASPEGNPVGVVPASSGDFGYVRAWAGSLEGNSLGAFTLAILPAAAALALRPGSVLGRLGFATCALLLLVALLVSYSRGAYLGLAVAGSIALLAFGRRRPLAAAAMAAAGLVLLVFLVTHLPGATDRVETLRSLGRDATVQHRQLVYAQAFDSLKMSPIWGVGLGTPLTVIGTGADSLFVFILLRGGLLAAGASVALLWTAGRQVLSAWQAERLRSLDLAVLISLSGVAAHSVVDYTLWNPKVALVVWLLAGLVMAAALDRGAEGVSSADDSEKAVQRW